MVDSETARSSDQAAASAPAGGAYKNYILFILLLTSTLNYVDRQIINILVEPIRRDLHLADWQIGMITGLSFAIFYSVLGIPIGRLADRVNRPLIIAGSLAVWSGFTFVCGWAQGFTHMLLARIGVGAGEAGGSPPAHSLISDYTTPQNRASALAVFSLGVPLGALFGLGAGGLLAEAVGWRIAFFIVSAPGLLLAALIVTTIKEPRDAIARSQPQAPPISLRDTIRELGAKPSYWWMAVAAACAATVINGHGAFYSSYFLRTYSGELAANRLGMGPLALAGVILGVVRGVGGALGTLAGGWWTDRAVRRDLRGYCTIPAISMVVSFFGFASVFMAHSAAGAAVMLFVPSFFSAAIVAPTFAAVQTMVAPRTRATAAAVMFFLFNIIGFGLGPLAVGALSDLFAAGLGRAEGLKAAMLAITPVALLSGVLYWIARRHVIKDLS